MDPENLSQNPNPMTPMPSVPQSPVPVSPMPIVPSVPIVVMSSPDEVTTPSQKSSGRGVKVILFACLFILLFLVAAGGFVYAVAYDKLDIKNKQISDPIVMAVQGLPFTPKTSGFLVYQAMKADEKITKQNVDMSIVLESADFASSLGISKVDGVVKGSVDYTDPKNVQLSANVAFTKEFNLDVIKKDKMVYLKINKVPSALFILMKMDEATLQPLLAEWIGLDVSTLNSEAEGYLEEVKKNDEQNSSLSEALIKDLSSGVTVTEESVDGNASYKMHLNISSDQLDRLETEVSSWGVDKSGDNKIFSEKTKASTVIKNLSGDMWIDKKDYYTRKIAVAFTIVTPDMNSLSAPVTQTLGVTTIASDLTKQPNSEVRVALVIKMSEFNQPVVIQAPEKYLSSEEFFQKYTQIIMEAAQSQSNPNL